MLFSNFSKKNPSFFVDFLAGSFENLMFKVSISRLNLPFGNLVQLFRRYYHFFCYFSFLAPFHIP